jgi:hypothetical protein
MPLSPTEPNDLIPLTSEAAALDIGGERLNGIANFALHRAAAAQYACW